MFAVHSFRSVPGLYFVLCFGLEVEPSHSAGSNPSIIDQGDGRLILFISTLSGVVFILTKIIKH